MVIGMTQGGYRRAGPWRRRSAYADASVTRVRFFTATPYMLPLRLLVRPGRYSKGTELVTLETRAVNQNGDLVLSLRHKIMIPAKVENPN